jgi:hypothetical protein
VLTFSCCFIWVKESAPAGHLLGEKSSIWLRPVGDWAQPASRALHKAVRASLEREDARMRGSFAVKLPYSRKCRPAQAALRPATKKILGRTNENEPAWGSFFCKGMFCYMMPSFFRSA